MWILLEVISVIARLDTLEATVKQVNLKQCISFSIILSSIFFFEYIACTVIKFREMLTRFP